MDMKDLNELRGEFEAMQAKSGALDCGIDGSCISDEENREDYPDYLRAIYAEIMPPAKSGIYFSRWDLKRMAEALDESFAVDVRERMFQNFMQWIATPEDMLKVIEQFKMLMDAKTGEYKKYAEKYPSTKEMFDAKIKKSENSKKYLDKVYVEFFT
jgi:hypothetical protein